MGKIFKKFVFKDDLPDEIKGVSYKIDPRVGYDIIFDTNNVLEILLDDSPASGKKSINEYITRTFDINKLKIRERIEMEKAYEEKQEKINNKPKFTFELNH
jgi:hypothetical protein